MLGVSSDGTEVRVVPVFCHRWDCPRCGRAKRDHWANIARLGKPDRFITLTMRHDDNTDPVQLAHVFKLKMPRLIEKIRRTWGAMEYMYVFELHKSGHPHVHMLQRGEYIPHKWLSREWQKLTGSWKVDIRKIRRERDISKYVSKYLGKDTPRTSRVFAGRRIVGKSNGWLDVADEKDMPQPNVITEAGTVWMWARGTPKDVIADLHQAMGANLEKVHENGTYTLRAPPRPDGAAYVAYVTGMIDYL